MNWDLIIHAIGLAALSAYSVSLLTGIALMVAKPRLFQIAPAARARLLLGLTFLPAFVAISLQMGWAFVRHPPHALPVAEHTGCPIPLTLPFAAITALFAVRVVLAAGTAGTAAWRSFAGVRALRRRSEPTEGGFRLCPSGAPLAYVAGLFKPRIFISRALLDGIDASGLHAIVAHERAHARRRDPLRRVLAGLALSFHLPLMSKVLAALLCRAQESAADAEAAREVGDAETVAEALVRVARLRLVHPELRGAAAIFGGGELEARVSDLLASGKGVEEPSPRALTAIFAVVFVVSMLLSAPVHLGAEILVRLVG